MYTIKSKLVHGSKVLGFSVEDENNVITEKPYSEVWHDLMVSDDIVKNAMIINAYDILAQPSKIQRQFRKSCWPRSTLEEFEVMMKNEGVTVTSNPKPRAVTAEQMEAGRLLGDDDRLRDNLTKDALVLYNLSGEDTWKAQLRELAPVGTERCLLIEEYCYTSTLKSQLKIVVDLHSLENIKSEPASEELKRIASEETELKVTGRLGFMETEPEAFIKNPATLGYRIENIGNKSIVLGGSFMGYTGHEIEIQPGESKIVGRSTLFEMMMLGDNFRLTNCAVVSGSIRVDVKYKWYIKAKPGVDIPFVQCGELVNDRWTLKPEYDIPCLVYSARDRYTKMSDRDVVSDYLVGINKRWNKRTTEVLTAAHRGV